MPVRVRYKITASVSSTTAEERDLANQQWEIVNDTQGEGGSWKSTLQPGEVDQELNLGNLTNATLVIVRITANDPTQNPGQISIRRNDIAGESFVIQPLGDAKEGHFLMATDALTALFATNLATVAMDVTVIAVGD